MSDALSISEADLQALIAARVAAVLSSELLESMARARVEERIGIIPLDEAARRLGKRNRRAMLHFARQHHIPVHEFSREDRFIRIKDLEAALEKCEVIPADSSTGTRVGLSVVKGKRALAV